MMRNFFTSQVNTRPTGDCSVSMSQANVLMLAFAVPAVAVLAALYVTGWGWPSLRAGLYWYLSLWVFLPSAIIGIVVHELIHAGTWALFTGRPLRAVQLGFQARTLTPFAHLKAPAPVNAYRLGTVMPCLLLGVLPALAALVSGQGGLMAFGLFFTFVAGGDLLILWLIRHVRADHLVQDHPERAGCLVMEDGQGADVQPHGEVLGQ